MSETIESPDGAVATPESVQEPASGDAIIATEDADSVDVESVSADPLVPERYELAAPEGMDLDAAMLIEFEPVARELGLTNEQAQSLADAYARRMQAMAAGHLEDWNRQTDRLAETVLADREIGGGQAAFAEKRAVMKRGLASLDDQELGRAIEEGRPIHPNSPGLLRALYRLGRAAAEDGFAEGGLSAGPPGSGPQAWARSLYPTLTSQRTKE